MNRTNSTANVQLLVLRNIAKHQISLSWLSFWKLTAGSTLLYFISDSKPFSTKYLYRAFPLSPTTFQTHAPIEGLTRR